MFGTISGSQQKARTGEGAQRATEVDRTPFTRGEAVASILSLAVSPHGLGAGGRVRGVGRRKCHMGPEKRKRGESRLLDRDREEDPGRGLR